MNDSLLSEGRQSFFDRSPVIRWLLGIFFVCVLLLFLHFREMRLQLVELNTEANRYLIAQLDYEFPDDENTLILRQEAIRDIDKIYRLNGVAIAKAELDKQLAEHEQWQADAPGTTLEEIEAGVEGVADVLAEARLTDPKTLSRMESLGLPTANYFAISAADEDGSVHLPEGFWQQVEMDAKEKSSLDRAAMGVILHGFAVHEWKLEDDADATSQIRRDAAAAVPRVMTKVAAGSRIIDKGETVTARHVASVQAMNRALGAKRNLYQALTWIGSLILTLLFVGVAASYLWRNHASLYFSNRQLGLVVTILVLTLAIAKAIEYVLLRSTTHLVDSIHFPMLVPFAAILLCSLLNGRIATFLSTLLAVAMTLSLVVYRSEFLVVNVIASLVAIFMTRAFRRRKEVFVVCAWAWFAAVAVVVAFHLYDNSLASVQLWIDLVTTFVFMLITAVLVVGLLPLLESLFRVMTDATLMEFMDPTHPLLRRLSMEAPGTYQHSIVVGNLAETAALSIGANGLFCRAAALYHDIGKVVSPQYFTENSPADGIDVHQLLTPLESAQAIMGHVSEGVIIARRHDIPEAIVDVIRQHHGTTLVYYFYHKALEQAKDEGSAVDEKEFRYSGPKPRRKETAIIMIADTAEAASRSLDEVTEESLGRLVDRLVREKGDDGQFDDCEMTYREIELVKRTIVDTLVIAGHSRIKYPTRTPLPPSAPADDPASS